MDRLPQNKKQSILEILFESLRPFLQSIEVDIETVKPYLFMYFPVKWVIIDNESINIEITDRIENFNAISFKSKDESINIDFLIKHVKYIIKFNQDKEKAEQKLKAKLQKENEAFEKKVQKLKNNVLGTNKNLSFIEIPEIIKPNYLEHIHIDEEEVIETDNFYKPQNKRVVVPDESIIDDSGIKYVPMIEENLMDNKSSYNKKTVEDEYIPNPSLSDEENLRLFMEFEMNKINNNENISNKYLDEE
jgi:hypothetical protein